jgi:predicted secreted Zn-dependent protease
MSLVVKRKMLYTLPALLHNLKSATLKEAQAHFFLNLQQHTHMHGQAQYISTRSC